ncbi:MAG TPA: Na(+)-translocating NADH-quinone reductase subunit C [Candidatus Hydrogenedentes bacterium]|nr:Na(+)-translocating NADH-quinone reductase subunit C [Candidatus Hydrogenedentota bacterium]
MKYIFGFAAAVCFVCSILISTANVALRERQEVNKLLDKQKSVLQAAWLVQPGEKVDRARVEEIFQNIRPRVLDVTTGQLLDAAGEDEFDESKAPEMPAPDNNAGIRTMPEKVQIYEVMEDGRVTMLVLPIVGKGLWSTMKGFLALDADGRTIRGLTYYEQAETPGLGGEVDNPRWKALWPGRLAYDDAGKPAIQVIKGPAGTPEEAPYEVDGLSGATLTSRGVTNMLQFWLGENGYAPFLKSFGKSGRA